MFIKYFNICTRYCFTLTLQRQRTTTVLTLAPNLNNDATLTPVSDKITAKTVEGSQGITVIISLALYHLQCVRHVEFQGVIRCH